MSSMRNALVYTEINKFGKIITGKTPKTEILEDSIADQDWSLNAGRYVGVVIEDDGMTEEEFKEHMISLNKEFEKLSGEAKTLEEAIAKNLKELFGE